MKKILLIFICFINTVTLCSLSFLEKNIKESNLQEVKNICEYIVLSPQEQKRCIELADSMIDKRKEHCQLFNMYNTPEVLKRALYGYIGFHLVGSGLRALNFAGKQANMGKPVHPAIIGAVAFSYAGLGIYLLVRTWRAARIYISKKVELYENATEIKDLLFKVKVQE